MVEIQGKKYLTTKEASHIYGYSISWFKKNKKEGTGPHHIKVGDKKRGKIYYEKNCLDDWFLSSK